MSASGCPQLRILATSREPLAIAGERVWSYRLLDEPETHALLARLEAGEPV